MKSRHRSHGKGNAPSKATAHSHTNSGHAKLPMGQGKKANGAKAYASVAQRNIKPYDIKRSIAMPKAGPDDRTLARPRRSPAYKPNPSTRN